MVIRSSLRSCWKCSHRNRNLAHKSLKFTHQTLRNSRACESAGKFGLQRCQVRLQTGVAERRSDRKLINFILFVEGKGKAENVMVLMDRGFVVENVSLGDSLPLRAAGGLHQRRQAVPKQISRLAQIYDVENHALVLLHVVDGEVEPKPVPRVAGVWPQK